MNIILCLFIYTLFLGMKIDKVKKLRTPAPSVALKGPTRLAPSAPPVQSCLVFFFPSINDSGAQLRPAISRHGPKSIDTDSRIPGVAPQHPAKPRRRESDPDDLRSPITISVLPYNFKRSLQPYNTDAQQHQRGQESHNTTIQFCRSKQPQKLPRNHTTDPVNCVQLHYNLTTRLHNPPAQPQ